MSQAENKEQKSPGYFFTVSNSLMLQKSTLVKVDVKNDPF